MSHCWPDHISTARDADPVYDRVIRRSDTRVIVGETVEDALDGMPDVDWFDFEGNAGAHYTIDLRVANDRPFYGTLYFLDPGTNERAQPSVNEHAGFSVHRLIVKVPETAGFVGGHAYGLTPYTRRSRSAHRGRSQRHPGRRHARDAWRGHRRRARVRFRHRRIRLRRRGRCFLPD